MTRVLVLVALTLAVGCGKGSGDVDAGPTFIDGFAPPAAPAGYTRYVTPPLDNIAPMDGTLWCQWIAPASATAVNVVDVQGHQSKYGHHVALYATTDTEPVGTSRACTTADMTTVRFLGAIGGEGVGSAAQLPEGVVFQLPAGQALLANVHFLNLGTTDIQGQAVLDVKYDAPNSTERVSGFFNNTSTHFQVPAGQHATYDLSCPIGEDMNFFMFSNHMHQYGISASTTVIRADGGETDTVVTDDTWSAEEQFNPSWNRWSLDAPFPINSGDTLNTHCEWTNTTGGPLSFPTEMCVGVGFFLPPGGGSGTDIYCVDNQWSVGAPP